MNRNTDHNDLKDIAGGFAKQIISELKEEGADINENTIEQKRAEIRLAVEQMIEDAADAAKGKKASHTYDDVFSDE